MIAISISKYFYHTFDKYIIFTEEQYLFTKSIFQHVKLLIRAFIIKACKLI